MDIDSNQRTNTSNYEQPVSETSLSSDCEMKADAASGNPTKIFTNTDSQSKNSRKRKMLEFSCNPGMQKHELFFLLLLNRYTTITKGGKREVIVRLLKGAFSYRNCYRLPLYYRRLLLINSKTYIVPISIDV